MSKAIAIVGQGFVGGSLTTVLSERNIDVFAFDKARNYKPGAKPSVCKTGICTFPSSIEELVTNCESKKNFCGIYFVCLPTPMQEDGSCDLSIVEGVIKQISIAPVGNCMSCDGTGNETTMQCKSCGGSGNSEKTRIIIVKSTVPPGSTERWNQELKDANLNTRVIFCPEFLTEANALDDMRNQTRIILGGPRPYINAAKQLFQLAFPNVPIIKTSSSTAEMVKHVTNIHLAVKVLLANEFYQICTALDDKGANIDYDKVIEYATLDNRLGKSHWQVPGPMPADDTGEPAFGVGGSCFPKDLNSLIFLAKSLRVDPKIMSAAWQKNLEVRPQRDYLKLVGRAVSVKK